jgi:peptide/nickel transport system permease protein
MTTPSRALGYAIMAVLGSIAVAAPFVAPSEPWRQHADLAYAPPMPPRIVDDRGHWRWPFVYPMLVENRLERRYAADRSRPAPLRFFSDGHLASTAGAVWFPLGADPLGRDVFSRIAHGARRSLAVAIAATMLAIGVGALAGAFAGFSGGLTDRVITTVADFIVILPAAYVVVTLRASLPLVLSSAEVFWTMVLVLAAASWPLPARGVRAIIAAERRREYAEAAYAVGAGRLRILLRHLLPAARSHLATQAFLLFPAFILAEATLSFLGLGFAEPDASWGVMLKDAGRVSAITEAPWMLAPAGAIVAAVLATHLVVTKGAESEPAVRL